MSEALVLEDLRDNVCVLTLNRPDKKNAFNDALYHALADALRGAQANPEVRVIVLTGAGDAFSAGQDMSEMNVEAGAKGGFTALLATLGVLDKPIIAAVNGVGVGLGLTILLHTDLNYIAEGARLRPPFVTLGVVPEAASSFLLTERMGHQRAAELLFTARWISARECVELGLALAAVPREQLLETAMAKAREIARQPPAAVRHTKRLLKVWRQEAIAAAREREDEAFQVRLRSPENAEAIAAFFEKRPADFSKIPPE
jgi:enoyl-CoA hydratase/carnithine racemase